MLLLLSLLACDEVLLKEPTVEILAPLDGAVLQVDRPALLQAELTGADDAVRVHWGAGDWSVFGNGVEVSDLPYGDLTLIAEAQIDGAVVQDQVSVQVRQVAAPTSYSGTLSLLADVWSAAYGNFEGVTCQHVELVFDLDLDGALVGRGSCSSPIGTYAFGLAGAVDRAEVQGSMTIQDTEDALSFEGSRSEDDTVEATFDQSFTAEDGQGTLRLYGGFSAAPVR
ncbi:MAG: hypothetical protein JXX28_11620 [Deltaproteobacteria bacterium]|nr:hypothetical protein [Deltaproteobacteria bacterium]